MASSCPEEVEAMRQLGALVSELGLSHVVYLLAELAEEQRDVSLSTQDVATATKWAHDGKVLGRAAMSLLE
jgi:hypothetical protein